MRSADRDPARIDASRPFRRDHELQRLRGWLKHRDFGPRQMIRHSFRLTWMRVGKARHLHGCRGAAQIAALQKDGFIRSHGIGSPENARRLRDGWVAGRSGATVAGANRAFG